MQKKRWSELFPQETKPNKELLGKLENGARVVLTGQQPGRMGGPVYGWIKAMATIAQAKILEETSGIPHVPVYWLGSEDHDWHEAAIWATVHDKSQVRKIADISLWTDHLPNTMVGLLDAKWGSDWLDMLQRLHPDSIKNISQEYGFQQNEQLELTQIRLFQQLFSQAPILIFSPLNPMGMKSQADFFEFIGLDNLKNAVGDIQKQQQQNNDFPFLIDDLHETSFVFHRFNGQREKLNWDEIKQIPVTELSGGAPWRVIWQQWLFNPVQVILGPGENRYWKPVIPIMEHLIDNVPEIVARPHLLFWPPGIPHDQVWLEWFINQNSLEPGRPNLEAAKPLETAWSEFSTIAQKFSINPKVLDKMKTMMDNDSQQGPSNWRQLYQWFWPGGILHERVWSILTLNWIYPHRNLALETKIIIDSWVMNKKVPKTDMIWSKNE